MPSKFAEIGQRVWQKIRTVIHDWIAQPSLRFLLLHVVVSVLWVGYAAITSGKNTDFDLKSVHSLVKCMFSAPSHSGIWLLLLPFPLFTLPLAIILLSKTASGHAVIQTLVDRLGRNVLRYALVTSSCLGAVLFASLTLSNFVQFYALALVSLPVCRFLPLLLRRLAGGDVFTPSRSLLSSTRVRYLFMVAGLTVFLRCGGHASVEFCTAARTAGTDILDGLQATNTFYWDTIKDLLRAPTAATSGVSLSFIPLWLYLTLVSGPLYLLNYLATRNPLAYSATLFVLHGHSVVQLVCLPLYEYSRALQTVLPRPTWEPMRTWCQQQPAVLYSTSGAPFTSAELSKLREHLAADEHNAAHWLARLSEHAKDVVSEFIRTGTVAPPRPDECSDEDQDQAQSGASAAAAAGAASPGPSTGRRRATQSASRS